ncbi:hypothetical protein TUMSATVNIG1_59020 (plasmid) [Vibrio nigripulchritudo]|uniref:DUF1868 domain-containing protein n=1 Tax=Vibrio nigripulchritudo TaxID=28173 RepID=UPI00190947C3|nr:DUF1868 domain-containing protein [Vibrio nigripulchritudo]BCL73917.1 hypothetical protein VNTUMSATTG_58540 [Vibrio nigripulchritudo]BDU35293.1 hypothetical protein TUMSATVNIG1_59020 [Vibrio nigripulchritudo]
MNNIDIWQGKHRPKNVKPKAIGYKYNEDGTAYPFDANTIVCHIDKQGALFQKLLVIRNTLKALSFADKFGWMPSESYHMTLFGGVNDPVRRASDWSDDFSLDTPIAEITEHFINVLKSTSIPNEYQMKPFAMVTNNSGCITLKLKPATEESERDVREARDILRDVTKINRPDHNEYYFHVTFTYQTKWLTEEEAILLDTKMKQLFDELFADDESVAINKPQLCTCKTMEHFEPVLDLF